MSKELNPTQFVEAVDEINDKAMNAVIALLKEKGDKCYIALPEYEDTAEGFFVDNCGNLSLLSVFGVGLDEKGELCVGATVDNVGYGHDTFDFPQAWTNTNVLQPISFPSIYCFVAEHIDEAITKEEADKIAEEYWVDEEDWNNGMCEEDDEYWEEDDEEFNED